jgi:nitrogen fixation/metabolism regulation signal transduction histidine kinase
MSAAPPLPSASAAARSIAGCSASVCDNSRNPLRYERRIVVTALAALLPIAAASLLLAFTGGFSVQTRWTLAFFIALSLFIATYVLREQLVNPLRTLSNLLSAVREEDYSLRARHAAGDDALSEVMTEVNALSAILQSRKFEAIEATALLRTVLEEIDAAIFAFDSESHLRFANRAGERLLSAEEGSLNGVTADAIGLGDLLEAVDLHAIDRIFPGRSGRWDVRRSTFREQGKPHRLLVIADISRALREEEAEAWRRIVRVLGHELNNSLAPIKSIATSAETLVRREELPADWRDDVVRGMQVIGSRAEALTRFMRAYSQLARLPPPQMQPVDLAEVIARTAALETRVPVTIKSGQSVKLAADRDQLEQAIINLIRNAAEASLETHGSVEVMWSVHTEAVDIRIIDEGLGLAGTANLFVPFFTTKPSGTGVGLVLSRQIAEAHGGTLTLENREGVRGCVATMTLQLTSSPSTR